MQVLTRSAQPIALAFAAIVIAAIVSMWSFHGSDAPGIPDTGASEGLYTSAGHGFSFSYPAEYQIIEKSADDLLVTGDGGASIAEIRIENAYPAALRDFAAYAKSVGAQTCGSVCAGVSRSYSYLSANSLIGEETYYFKQGSVSDESGPYYVFRIPSTPDTTKILFAFPIGRRSTPENAQVLRMIASSLSIDQSWK